MLNRMLGAAQLKVSTFEEVEADKSATSQALLVVIMVAVATGVGTIGQVGVRGIVGGIIVGVLGWALWAAITYFVGTRLFRTSETQADWGQLARTLGFAQTPGLLKVLGFVPGVGGLIVLLATVWQIVAMVIGVRQALDYTSTWRAVGVVVVGFIPYAALYVLLVMLIGTPGAAS